MVWDAYKCHISAAVKAECAKLSLQTSIVPGGCTKFIQAADVVWNAPFKSRLRECYDTWLSEPNCHEYTKGGNMKAPSRGLLCEWVKSSWDEISTEMIKNSFKSCAITTRVDGSEDDVIHCFKENQPCAAGRSLLAQEMEKFDADNDDSDPFAVNSDEEETENNEVCIDDDPVDADL